MTDQAFEGLLTAYLEGDIPEDELRTLHSTVQASPHLRRRFQEATRLHVLLRETLSEQVEVQLIQESAALSIARPPRRWLLQATVALATTLLLSIGIFYYTYYAQTGPRISFGNCVNISGSNELYVERNSGPVQLVPEATLRIGDVIRCGGHSQATLRLFDGSILSLEPRSQVTLVSTRPEIQLDYGKVLFEIARRKENNQPFQVHTGQSTVDVMGTVFGLAENEDTQVEVYEGRVTLTRHSDNAKIEVGSQQTARTGGKDLAVEELSPPSRKTVSLLPTDDMTLDRGEPASGEYHLKVEGERRIAYLRFEIPDLPAIRSARLKLTQDVDAGTGTLRFFVGDHSDWSESSLAQETAPLQKREVAQHRGIVGRGQTVEVDVLDAIQRSGPITIIVTLDKTRENDIWFGSRERGQPPQLTLTYLPQPL